MESRQHYRVIISSPRRLLEFSFLQTCANFTKNDCVADEDDARTEEVLVNSRNCATGMVNDMTVVQKGQVDSSVSDRKRDLMVLLMLLRDFGHVKYTSN